MPCVTDPVARVAHHKPQQGANQPFTPMGTTMSVCEHVQASKCRQDSAVLLHTHDAIAVTHNSLQHRVETVVVQG